MEALLGSVFNYMYVQINVTEGRKGAIIGGMSNLCKGTSKDIEKIFKSLKKYSANKAEIVWKQRLCRLNLNPTMISERKEGHKSWFKK